MNSMVARSRTTRAWPGRTAARVCSRRPDAVLGPGQVVTIEDLGAVASHRLGQGGVQLMHQGFELPGGIRDERAADVQFDPLELLVDGRQRCGDITEGRDIGGANRGLDAADDGGHQLDERGEEDTAGVSVGSGVLEEAIDLRRVVEYAPEAGADDDGDGCLLEETLEGFAELHECRPCPEWLS